MDIKLVKKYIITFSIVLLIIVATIILYKFLSKKYFKKSTKSLVIDKQISKKNYSVPNDSISKPNNGFDFTVSFWLYIDDYDFNYGSWKHVIHKGTIPNTQELQYDNGKYSNWNSLSADLSEQTPGIWLHPTQNILRFGISTNNKDDCKYDEHAFENFGKGNKIDSNIDPNKNIEYIDIPNVPIKKMIHYSFVLDNKIIYVYINGKLNNIKKLEGMSKNNNGDYYFNFPKTFDGELYNFRYIPKVVKSQQLYLLYKDLPNTNRFTKKERIMYYLSRLKLKKALFTFF